MQTLTATFLSLELIGMGQLAHTLFRYDQHIVTLAELLHADDLIIYIEADTAYTHRAATGHTNIRLIKADRHTIPCTDHDIFTCIDQLRFDELVIVPQRHCDETGLTDIRIIRNRGLLHHTVLRRKQEILIRGWIIICQCEAGSDMLI